MKRDDLRRKKTQRKATAKESELRKTIETQRKTNNGG